METKDIGEPSLWIPMTDPVVVAAIAKLGEECNELGAIIFRTIIQGGLDKADPDTGELNLHALQKEIADVVALGSLVIEFLDLDRETMIERSDKKHAMKRKWLNMLKEAITEKHDETST